MYTFILAFLGLTCPGIGYRLHTGDQIPSWSQEEYPNKPKVNLSQSQFKRPGEVAHALARLLLAFSSPASGWRARHRCGDSHLAPLPSVAQPMVRRALPPCALALPTTVAPVATLAVLTGVIVIHEGGHFLAARLQGIRASQFSVGFGPPILRLESKDSAKTDFVLRALPIGGYVSFPRKTNSTYLDQLEKTGMLKPGEKSKFEVKDSPDLLENRPARQRAAVMVAGILANLVLAWGCFFATGVSLGVPMLEPQQVVVTRVDPNSIAENVGFRQGDKMIQVGNLPIKGGSSDKRPGLNGAMKVWRAYIDERRPFDVDVERGSMAQRVHLTVPKLPSEQRLIGIVFSEKTSAVRERLSPVKSASVAVDAVLRQSVIISSALRDGFFSFVGKSSSPSSQVQIQGPLGITKMGSELATEDVRQLLEFAAILSMNLAVFNALPLPGLDGWMLLLLLFETARGSKISDSTQQTINSLASALFFYGFIRILFADAQVAVDGQALMNSAKEYGPTSLLAIASGVGTAELIKALESGTREGTDNAKGRQKTAKFSRSSSSSSSSSSRSSSKSSSRSSRSSSGSSSMGISWLRRDTSRRGSQSSQRQRAKRSLAKAGVDDTKGWLSRLDPRLRSSRSS